MSLVNQVLKDLERRRGAGSDATGLRAAVTRHTRRWPAWLPWTLLAVVIGVGLYAVEPWLRPDPVATEVEPPPVVVATPEPVAPPVAEPEPVLPQLTRVVTTQRERELTLTLEFDAAIEARHFVLDVPHRLVIDLPGVNRDAQPSVPVPEAQQALMEAAYQDAPDSGLRLVLTLADDATSAVATPAPDVLTVTLTVPPPPVVVARTEPQSPPPRTDAASVPAIPTPQPQNPPQSEGTQQRTLVATSPRQRAEEAYDEGVRALAEGRIPRAESQFRAALGHDASLHTARLALASLLYQQGRLREAEVQLQEGLRITPGEPSLSDRYARMLLERGDLSGAIGVLSTAPPPVETHPEHHALLAALLQRAGNHDAAIAAYTELVAVNDRQGLWWMGLAISLEAVARPAAALEAYRQAIRDPRLSTDVARFVRERTDALSLAAGEAP